MKRFASALALVLALGGTAGCADYTTTGVPAEEGNEVTEVGESLAPGVDPLVGTSWTLTSAESTVADLATFPITATFEEGVLSGQAPVNSYTASYEVEADTEIQIGPIAATKMAGPAAAMAAEGAYFTLLEQVTGFVVSSEELQLIAEGEPILVYAPAEEETEDPAAAEAEALATTLIGMSAEEAEEAVTEAGLTYRVIAEDGVYNAVTSDYNPSRINVEITSGTITTASVG